ncbi:hypothetical protein FISHEDRAFT_55217 [Fistulina hepatica ATCC 64428]|uniref:Uncharacterized protein n=1 Tax=Fistulina hepatica ATCC 64428 TaxID=1128425 RepID=A0A0D7ANM8_9AGAR|nr:hypothetical protein FISHEDRAFT_55217 [Fistulina hepatica ATCC 64428]
MPRLYDILFPSEASAERRASRKSLRGLRRSNPQVLESEHTALASGTRNESRSTRKRTSSSVHTDAEVPRTRPRLLSTCQPQTTMTSVSEVDVSAEPSAAATYTSSLDCALNTSNGYARLRRMSSTATLRAVETKDSVKSKKNKAKKRSRIDAENTDVGLDTRRIRQRTTSNASVATIRASAERPPSRRGRIIRPQPNEREGRHVAFPSMDDDVVSASLHKQARAEVRQMFSRLPIPVRTKAFERVSRKYSRKAIPRFDDIPEFFYEIEEFHLEYPFSAGPVDWLPIHEPIVDTSNLKLDHRGCALLHAPELDLQIVYFDNQRCFNAWDVPNDDVIVCYIGMHVTPKDAVRWENQALAPPNPTGTKLHDTRPRQGIAVDGEWVRTLDSVRFLIDEERETVLDPMRQGWEKERGWVKAVQIQVPAYLFATSEARLFYVRTRMWVDSVCGRECDTEYGKCDAHVLCAENEVMAENLLTHKFIKTLKPRV